MGDRHKAGRTRRKAGPAAAVAAVLLLLGWAGGAAAGVGNEPASSTPSSTAAIPEAGETTTGKDEVAASRPSASSALALLETLQVKGRAPKTGYDRDEFGEAWADVDRNGCDTRNDILARDLDQVTFRSASSCRVTGGLLDDPYSGRRVTFSYGGDTSQLVPVDHVVSLSDAWQKGARQLSLRQRTQLANDPLNLLATTREMNSRKSDGDAATWLPENRSFRCTFIATQVSVKAAYSLWVTQAEHDAMARVLEGCPDPPARVREPLHAAGQAEAGGSETGEAGEERKAVTEPVAEASRAEAPRPAPARSVNCSDFDTHRKAQQWFEYYHPQLGDIAGLDGDGDLLACVSLP